MISTRPGHEPWSLQVGREVGLEIRSLRCCNQWFFLFPLSSLHIQQGGSLPLQEVELLQSDCHIPYAIFATGTGPTPRGTRMHEGPAAPIWPAPPVLPFRAARMCLPAAV